MSQHFVSLLVVFRPHVVAVWSRVASQQRLDFASNGKQRLIEPTWALHKSSSRMTSYGLNPTQSFEAGASRIDRREGVDQDLLWLSGRIP